MHYVYSFREDLIYVPSLAMSLALIKRAPVLEAGRPLASQLQMMTLPGPASSDSSKEGGSGPGSTVAGIASTSMTPDVAGATDSAGPSPTTTLTSPSTSPYEALHAYIHHAVSPYFSAFASAKSKQEALAAAVAQSSAPGGPTGPGSLKRGAPGGPSGAPSDDKDGKMGIPMAKKKFAELELSLLHLQQNVEIPEIILSIHPAIQRAVEKVGSLLPPPLSLSPLLDFSLIFCFLPLSLLFISYPFLFLSLSVVSPIRELQLMPWMLVSLVIPPS